MRRIPQWLIILMAIVLACAGVKMWYDSLCSGDIDISGSAPDQDMLLHIIEHADELAAREDLFSVEVDENNHTVITCLGNPNFYWSYIMYSSDAYRDISGNADHLLYSGSYRRYPHSDFWNVVTPWSKISSKFSIFSVPTSFAFVLDAGIVTDTSDAPLLEMMSAIESVIGKP